MGAGRFFGSSVHSSHVFSGRLASHLPCMGPPTSLVWGDRGGPPPYTDAPPPYKAPLHCLLYYWPPHMEPSWALLHHHLCRDASSSSTFILSQSPCLFWEGPPLPLKGSVAMSLALLGLPLIWSLPGLSLRHCRCRHGKVQNNSISAETT